jgi:CBS domain-containing protein
MGALEQIVRDYQSSPVHSVGIDDDVTEADRLMREQRVSCLLVRGRSGQAAGVISHSDLLQLARVRARLTGKPALLELPAMCAGDAMTVKVISTTPGATIAEAAREMVSRGIHRLFVLDGDQPVGVLSTKDIMRAVLDAKLELPIERLMSTPVVTVGAAEPLGKAVEALSRARVAGVVVTEDGVPVGVFTQVEALEARDLAATAKVEDAMTQSMLCLPVKTPIYRAAGNAVTTRARRVLAVEDHKIRGILTGLDFARAAAGETAR